MNHDYAHCIDFIDSCPETCFRAELVRDLKNQEIKIVSWTHFLGTKECRGAHVWEKIKNDEGTVKRDP